MHRTGGGTAASSSAPRGPVGTNPFEGLAEAFAPRPSPYALPTRAACGSTNTSPFVTAANLSDGSADLLGVGEISSSGPSAQIHNISLIDDVPAPRELAVDRDVFPPRRRAGPLPPLSRDEDDPTPWDSPEFRKYVRAKLGSEIAALQRPGSQSGRLPSRGSASRSMLAVEGEPKAPPREPAAVDWIAASMRGVRYLPVTTVRPLSEAKPNWKELARDGRGL